MSSAFEAFLTIQCVLTIATLGHYLPLSMKQLDVGIAGYMAIGAYVSAILTRDFGLSFPLAIAAGMVAAAASSLLVDMLAARVRLSGFAYAIFAISFAESLRIILNNNDRVGGALGLAGIQHHTTLTGAAIALTIVILGFWALDRSRLGQLRTAIKDDEFIVPQLGVPLLATKLVIFAIGAALGGLAGGLYAHYVLFIRPDDFGFLLLGGDHAAHRLWRSRSVLGRHPGHLADGDHPRALPRVGGVSAAADRRRDHSAAGAAARRVDHQS